MKSIHFRSFKESFFQLDTSKKDSDSHLAPIWEKGFFRTLLTGFSHPQVLCFSIIVIFAIIGFQFRLALVLSLNLAAALTLYYYHLKWLAEQITLKFDLPPRVTEKQTARINFSIFNESFFSLNNLILQLTYDGSSKPNYFQMCSEEVAGRSVLRNFIDLNCDTGMGRFVAKDISICLSSLFGIFQFRVHFETKLEIEVRPKIEAIPHVNTRGSEHSDMYGQHEMRSRGLSVNFSNIRPYSFGDNIRHIAWRPSAKLGSLVVKEFEKMVNTDATLILNLNPSHHVGFDQLSSWETAKDVTLALASQLLDQNNSVEFIYNYGLIDKSNSKDQFYAISKLLIQHNIFEAADGQHKNRVHIDDPLQQWRHRIVPGSTLFYIGSVHYSYLRDATPLLKMLSREKVEVILTLINPLTVWSEFKEIDPTLEKPNTTSKINQLLTELQEVGVRVCFADMGPELKKGFREKSFLTEKSIKNIKKKATELKRI